MTIISQDQPLTVFSQKRSFVIKFNDLQNYRGERGQKGKPLPKGFQRVDELLG